MSIQEALQLMLTFGSLLISLISLVVAIVKNDKKNILRLVIEAKALAFITIFFYS